jgi:allophanate hydrolase subunit 2
VTPRNATDAHRPLQKQHHVPAILSHVEQRTISNDYTLQFCGQRYQIAKSSLRIGMRGERSESKHGSMEASHCAIKGSTCLPRSALKLVSRPKDLPNRFAKITIGVAPASG